MSSISLNNKKSFILVAETKKSFESLIIKTGNVSESVTLGVQTHHSRESQAWV